ncbi:hypothetical protein M0R72_11020 [Candidatus Pacearchaeota archaeon]|jgi:hypothetical protein|nr:hypothetical protein [Candidatus Pacearchaeota archaeon]
MTSTPIGPYEENRDFMKLKLSSGLLLCLHLPIGAYTWINETYYILWTMQEWLDAIAASGKTTEEFMAGIYRGPGKIGVVTDGRCDYCKAGEQVPPEMY